MEKVHENALLIVLHTMGLQSDQQRPIKVFSGDHIVGGYDADIIVDTKIILELKIVETVSKSHEVQIVNYLKAIKMEVGILFNFSKDKVQFKREELNL